MKNITYCLIGLFMLSLAWLSVSPLRAQNKRLVEVPIAEAPSYAKYALVVGVTDYESCPTLHVCGNDAIEFTKLLKSKFGFTDVVLMTDGPDTRSAMRPTQRNLKRALDTLYGSIIPDKSEVVLFFSGHGVRARDLGGNDVDWLVPNDGDPHDVPGTCINYNTIKQRLDTLRPARVLLVTDACRSLLSGKAIGDSSGFGKGLGIAAPLGPEVAELQSCQPTEVSQEGMPEDFGESVFTHFLIQGLNGDPDAIDTGNLVTFDSLKQYLQGSVYRYVASHFGNTSQRPDGRATLGRMVLVRTGPVPTVVSPAPIAPPAPVVPIPAPVKTTVKPTLYVLAVGISQYENPDLNLTFPAKDARDFAAVLQKQKGPLYRDVQVKLLTDGEATKAGITHGLEWITRQAAPNDVAMIFLTGHGVTDGGNTLFVPADFNRDKITATGLSFSDMKRLVKPLTSKTVFFVDVADIANGLSLAQNNSIVYAASTGTQDIMEYPSWTNGAFTKALLEAFSGKADYTHEGKVTINQLDLYLSQRVKDLTQGTQAPIMTKPEALPDFPVATLE